MEYERIHKVQTAVLSPSKLRMKLLGSPNSNHGVRKKETSANSATASPSRLEELEFSKNSLLAHDFVEEEQFSTLKVASAVNSAISEASKQDEHSTNGSGNSNFEFQREERPVQHSIPAPLFRQVPSKWNDAEKWIMSRHLMHSNPIFSKKSAAQNSQNQGANGVIFNSNVRVAPEMNASGESGVTECGSVSGRKKGVSHRKLSHLNRNINGTSGTASVQSVLMRDIGTEMTPVASQEQSMAGTPAGAATPTFSPLSSIPSTPKRGPPSSSSSDCTVDSRLWVQKKLRTVETPERELQMRTRQEIAALGLKLGKFNIASWASKEEFPEESECDDNFEEGESAKRAFEVRAVAWEESQKSKLVARYKREEVKIQAWETSQQAKFEAQAEQMKLRAQQKTAKKLSAIRQKAEGKQAKMEARKTRRVARLAKEVEQIRRTGRAPTSCLRCCSWFSFGLLSK